ncbi:hypothetical protein C8R44DRAFT_739858 [Mycena epipterygia]|nr:hypothetical protein C8R44DRAFT_739858 [Mycena epipterygia]
MLDLPETFFCWRAHPCFENNGTPTISDKKATISSGSSSHRGVEESVFWQSEPELSALLVFGWLPGKTRVYGGMVWAMPTTLKPLSEHGIAAFITDIRLRIMRCSALRTTVFPSELAADEWYEAMDTEYIGTRYRTVADVFDLEYNPKEDFFHLSIRIEDLRHTWRELSAGTCKKVADTKRALFQEGKTKDDGLKTKRPDAVPSVLDSASAKQSHSCLGRERERRREHVGQRGGWRSLDMTIWGTGMPVPIGVQKLASQALVPL